MLSPTHRSPRVILEVPTSAVLTFDTQQRLTREEVPDLISYAKLWRLLDKRRLSPRDIVWMAGISESTYQKLVKNDVSGRNRRPCYKSHPGQPLGIHRTPSLRPPKVLCSGALCMTPLFLPVQLFVHLFPSFPYCIQFNYQMSTRSSGARYIPSPS